MADVAFEQAFDLEVALQGSKNNGRLKREEIEELVLKRCWLARYWGLAAKLGVFPAIAFQKHATWAKFALLSLEIVISAGEKVKLTLEREGHPVTSSSSTNSETGVEILARSATGRENYEDVQDRGKEDIESQLLVVDKGLRELAELRVEEAVLLTISQNQNPTLIWLGVSKEEAQDIRFKQAWLVYYWRRAQVSKVVEQDIAMERLLYWIDRTNKPASYQDAIDAERGLYELQSLNIERLLREVSSGGSSSA